VDEMSSIEQKAAKKWIDFNRKSDNTGPEMKVWHLSLEDAFTEGIKWERKRLADAIRKLNKEVMISMIWEDDDESSD
jgi:hypothetical protein